MSYKRPLSSYNHKIVYITHKLYVYILLQHIPTTALASNVMSLQYFAILYAMTGHMQAVSALFESKRLYERDTSASLYSPLVYWLVQATVHLPLLIVSFTVYLNIAYFSMGLTLEFVSAKYCYYCYPLLTAVMVHSLLIVLYP
jgi:ABC-type multidrug transport system permease subunit